MRPRNCGMLRMPRQRGQEMPRPDIRLTPDEQAEYGTYVSYGTFVAILKSKARQLLAASPGA